MITGAHFLLYTTDADADRAFLKDILGFPGVDAGGGWLIFKAPPTELAVHPEEKSLTMHHGPIPMAAAVFYLICDDLDRTMGDLGAKGVSCGRIGKAEWGRFTSFPLPSGVHLGLYQPLHPTAIEGGG
jgi:catechol 2,3-dioxygenase-like lactoylglutathione lyase family enzyme